MSEEADKKDEWVQGTVSMNIGGMDISMEMTVPANPINPRRMLPIFQKMTNSFVDLAVQEEKEKGYTISCKAGCGACCRQLVPISEFEAHQLKELVDHMAEPRQSAIRQRFADAINKFGEAGLLEQLRNPDSFVDQTVKKLGLDYFHTGVPCPFLEDESCSIHPDRPLACREYLVTSPAENCSHPTADSVRQVKIPAKVSNAVIRLSKPREGSRFIPYVPMILALEWAENNPENMPPKPGPMILKEMFENLSGQEVKT